jgi:16S rRNA (guanine966-N2)-methyltransferase
MLPKRTKVPRKKPQISRRDTNTLRIIAGEWRSRKLPFIDTLGLRPTPDRVRETLFNWLQADIRNASCLDLYAGSGALGLEALSRGAREVVFVEKNAACANQLKKNLEILKANSTVLHTDALGYLGNFNHSDASGKNFDVIFLDPPYRQGLLDKSLKQLIRKKIISKNTLVYLEHEAEESFDWSEYGLQIVKQTVAGQVQSFLLKTV